MNAFGQDHTELMGLGALGEIRRAPDGNLYQWVHGVDGLGNPVGFWKKLKRFVRKARGFARKWAPMVQRFASAIPLPQAQAVAKGIQTAQGAGVFGVDGLGTLYETPDGTVYQVQGVADGDVSQILGVGSLGEVRQGPDGNLYEWTHGVDGLGNPVGFWKKLKRFARRAHRFVKKLAPMVQKVASFIPLPQAQAVAKGIELARGAGVLGVDGVGALYESPDGTVYQGIDDDDVQGLAAEDEIQGFADDEVQGYGQDEDGTAGLAAYVPDAPAGTRWFQPPAQAPDIWKPLW